MKTVQILAVAAIATILCSCGTVKTALRPRIEANLSDVIVGSAAALTEAERQIVDGNLNTFGLRPSKATVHFELSNYDETTRTLGVSLAPGTTVGGLSGGWTGTVGEKMGNSITIEFTPGGK